MRGRAISFLLVLLSTIPAFSDCNWVPRYSGQFRSTVYDVAVDGEGKPRPIAPLQLASEEDRRRHADAEFRRAERLRAAGRVEATT